MSTFYFAAYALNVVPKASYIWMCRFDILNQPISIALLAMCTIGIYTQHKKKLPQAWVCLTLMLPAIIQAVSAIIVYHLLGMQQISSLYERLDNNEILSPGEITPIHNLFFFVTETMRRIVCSTFIIINICGCLYTSHKEGYKFGDAYKFWFKGQDTTPTRSINLCLLFILSSLIPMNALGRVWLVNNPITSLLITVFLSAWLFMFGYVVYMSDIKTFNLYNLSHAEMFYPHNGPYIINNVNNGVVVPGITLSTPEAIGNRTVVVPLDPSVTTQAKQEEIDNAKTNSNATRQKEDTESNNQEEIIEDKGNSESVSLPVDDKIIAKDDALAVRMRQLFIEEKVYTDPRLTLQGLAEMLNTNRNTLSVHINQNYGMTFKQLLATYRIEHAKRYMLEHPEETNESVAQQTGFLDFSAFNHKFKELVGESPRQWLAKQ